MYLQTVLVIKKKTKKNNKLISTGLFNDTFKSCMVPGDKTKMVYE